MVLLFVVTIILALGTHYVLRILWRSRKDRQVRLLYVPITIGTWLLFLSITAAGESNPEPASHAYFRDASKIAGLSVLAHEIVLFSWLLLCETTKLRC